VVTLTWARSTLQMNRRFELSRVLQDTIFICRCLVTLVSFVILPGPLKRGDGLRGGLEVTNFNSNKAAKNKAASKNTRSGKNTAVIDGSVQKGVLSIGVWYGEGHPLNFSGRITGNDDNNRAELAAVYWAVLHHPRVEPLCLFSDSSHVVDCMRTLALKGPAGCRCTLTLMICLLLHLRLAPTTIKKIKAHSNNPSSDMADAMARLGTRSKDSRYVPEGTGALSIRHALLLVTCPGFVSFCTSAATRIRDSPTGAVHMEGMESSNKLGSKDVTYGPPLAKSDNFSKTPLLGVDCEMVGVGVDGVESELARVCIINQHGNVLLDELAKPERRITDYRTQHSGIRASDLKNAAPVPEVQRRVANLVRGHILVGHGLDNDLAVLGLMGHPAENLRDTARIARFCYGGRLGRPRKLRDLAAKYLQIRIQGGEHSPVDDARAAMYLYKAYEQGLSGR